MKKLTAVLLSLVLALTLAGCREEIYHYDASQYAYFVLQGENGSGSLSVFRDASQFSEILSDLVETAGQERADKVELALNSLQFTIEPRHRELSNGEILTITATYDEELAEAANIAFTGTSFPYTVQGLRQPSLSR